MLYSSSYLDDSRVSSSSSEANFLADESKFSSSPSTSKFLADRSKVSPSSVKSCSSATEFLVLKIFLWILCLRLKRLFSLSRFFLLGKLLFWFDFL